MSGPEPQPAGPPLTPRFQFSLRTLLLLFVVLASSLAVFGAWGIAAFAVEIALAFQVLRKKPYGCVAILMIGTAILLALWPVVDAVSESRPRAACSNNLRQLALALHCYRTTYNGQFPPAYSVDKCGTPLLSWRVLILPLLNDDTEVTLVKVFQSFNKNEPWNGPTNKSISAQQHTDFSCPGERDSDKSGPAQTNYLAVVGPGAAWAGDKPRSDADFHGDAASTIMLVEASNPGINWAEPRDLSIDALIAAAGKSRAVVPSSRHGEHDNFLFFEAEEIPSVNVAMVDGSVHSLWLNGLSRNELWKVLQIGGCGPDVIRTLSHRPLPRHLNWPNIAALAMWLLSVGLLLAYAVWSRKPRSVPLPPPAS